MRYGKQAEFKKKMEKNGLDFKAAGKKPAHTFGFALSGALLGKKKVDFRKPCIYNVS